MKKQGFGHTGKRNLSAGELQWQVRINLAGEFADAARANPADPVLKPLLDILAKYDASIRHQQMSFGGFLPYFEKEEKPQLEKKVAAAFEALKNASGGDVNAAIDALKAYEQASADYAERTRLYLWTKDTLAKPETAKKYATRFTIYADGHQEVYSKATAEGLVADLQALVDSGMIEKINKFDSDPAHNPQAPARFHNDKGPK